MFLDDTAQGLLDVLLVLLANNKHYRHEKNISAL
jgi:hypothetical protein